MSLTNDFFAANSAEMAALDARFGRWPEPPKKLAKKRWWSRGETEGAAPPEVDRPSLPIVEARGILDVELASLETLLEGRPIGDIDAVVSLIQDPIRQEPADNPEAWISPLSPGLAAALTDVSDERISAVVPEWLATEEMARSGWSNADAEGLLRGLRELVRRADQDGRHVYRWFAL